MVPKLSHLHTTSAGISPPYQLASLYALDGLGTSNGKISPTTIYNDRRTCVLFWLIASSEQKTHSSHLKFFQRLSPVSGNHSQWHTVVHGFTCLKLQVPELVVHIGSEECYRAYKEDAKEDVLPEGIILYIPFIESPIYTSCRRSSLQTQSTGVPHDLH